MIHIFGMINRVEYSNMVTATIEFSPAFEPLQVAMMASIAKDKSVTGYASPKPGTITVMGNNWGVIAREFSSGLPMGEADWAHLESAVDLEGGTILVEASINKTPEEFVQHIAGQRTNKMVHELNPSWLPGAPCPDCGARWLVVPPEYAAHDCQSQCPECKMLFTKEEE